MPQSSSFRALFLRRLAAVGLLGLGLGTFACRPGQSRPPAPPPGDAGPPQLGTGSWVPVTPVTDLPALPPLNNLNAIVGSDSASISFDPVDGAQDYRVYVLPPDSGIYLNADGGVVIPNAVYRCAGDREAPPVSADGTPQYAGSVAVNTVVESAAYGYTRTLAGATLGYVYTAPGQGLVPVYALGDPAPDGDNSCYFQRWRQSRAKLYTTSDQTRANLLASRWRDDGIAFWIPAASSSATRSIYSAAMSDQGLLYFAGDDAEYTARASLNPTLSFPVLISQAAGTQPLMRVFYQNGCGRSHDELVVGQARFERARYQGNSPLFSVLWSGLTGPTTLVIEALDQGCPFQGQLAPQSLPEAYADGGSPHQPFFTLAQLQASSPSGEVFINGQHAPTNHPNAVARSFISVTPGPAPAMDWSDTFAPGAQLKPFSALPATASGGEHLLSPDYDLSLYMIDQNTTSQQDELSMGVLLGQLWIAYADAWEQTNGKIRLTPTQAATLSATSYLHVTMQADTVTTGRRYPQILISDQPAPVQDNLPSGYTVLVQTFHTWPNALQIEVCDHRTWDVNNQCPAADLYHINDPANPSTVLNLAPNDEVGEHAGADRATQFDVYATTSRVYVFLDGKPYGCANLPGKGLTPGPTTVTFGDVLYHSAADLYLEGNSAENWVYQYHWDKLHYETKRHFDNLGFSSGVAAPAWDDTLLPCTSAFQ